MRGFFYAVFLGKGDDVRKVKFFRKRHLRNSDVAGQLPGRETDWNGNVAFRRRANELDKNGAADKMPAALF